MRAVADKIEEKYLGHLPYILGALTMFVCAALLAGALFQVRLSRPQTAPVAETATVVVFETAACTECDEFRSKIGRQHQSSSLAGKVPLRYYDVSDGGPPKKYKLNASVGKGPTAIVFDIYGREQARVDWVPKDLEEFQKRLLPHVRRAERDLEYANSIGH
jgi:hypothetical protein